MQIVEKAEQKAAPAKKPELQKQFQKLAKEETQELLDVFAAAAQMFEQAPQDSQKAKNQAEDA